MMGLSNHKMISDHAMAVRSWVMHHFNSKLWNVRRYKPPKDDYFDQQLMTADDEGMLPQPSVPSETRQRHTKGKRTSRSTH